jgi:SAM-dependent methyltransferase
MKTYSFDEHWSKNLNEEIPYMKKNEAIGFLQPLFDYSKSQGYLHILDAGCGDGVHIEIIESRFDRMEGGLFIGLDISMSALRSLKERRRSKCIFVQGDIGEMPFGNDQFDIVFSFGALAYTDNPFFSFSELCRITKTGGYIGIWVYPKNNGVGGTLFSLVRKFCKRLGPMCCRLIADCIVPFLGLIPTRSRMSLANSSWRQCREIVLVNIAPSQLCFPPEPEIEGWFRKNNLEIVWRDDKAPVTIWGKKI